jgi:hypothetical protein
MSNNPFAVQTVTKINPAEILQVRINCQELITNMSIRGGLNRVYGMDDDEYCKRVQLYLYDYFLSKWDTATDAYNYTTTAKFMFVLSATQQLLYDIKCGLPTTIGAFTVLNPFVPIPPIVPIVPSSNRVPFGFAFTVTVQGIVFTDPQLVGVGDLVEIVINQTTYQLTTGFNFSSLLGTIDMTPSGFILYPGDKITGIGSKLV